MRRLMTIVATLGCAFALAACVGQNDQKTDEATATSEQPARPPQRTTEQPRPAATTTAAPTPVQIAQCVQAGLAADNRTETQARTLQVGAWVTINGTRQRVATGQSYWSLCSGPTLQQRLTTAEARIVTLTRERDVARAETAAISGRLDRVYAQWVYVDPEAGNGVENTWKHRAEQDSGFGWLSWLITALMVGFLVATVVLVRANRRLTSQNDDLRFQQRRPTSEDLGGDGAVTQS